VDDWGQLVHRTGPEDTTHAIWCTKIRKFYRTQLGEVILMSEERARANVSAWNAWTTEGYKVVPWNEQAKAIHAGAQL
jgi:hypothetical protein